MNKTIHSIAFSRQDLSKSLFPRFFEAPKDPKTLHSKA
jgi:hypothetical protein